MKTASIYDFKDKIRKGTVLGPFSKTSDPAFIECMGYAGFDFVILDLEHGPNNVQSLQDLIRAAQISGVFPIVRVKENLPSLIGEVLDIGASGIQIPQVTSSDDVREIISHAKFAPEGMRGVCRFVRAAEYGSMDRFRYFKKANEIVIIIQLEGQKAIENIDEILSIKGYDIIFIGPYDLSQSLGVTGQVDHPLIEKKMIEIVEKCRRKNISMGTFVDSLENAKKWEKLGVRYISYSVDVGIFLDSCKEIIDKLRDRK